MCSGLDCFCGPSHGYCAAIERRRGRIKFELLSIVLHGKYTLCVKSPRHARTCEGFHLEADDDLYADRVDWLRHFGRHGRGRYAVRWKRHGQPLGRDLQFVVG